MAISNFIITELPSNVVSKIGSNPILINQLYDIANEIHLNFERISALNGFYLEKKVKYKAYDNQLQKYSNEAEINLTWKEQNLAIVPASADNTVTLVNSQTINLLDYLPINSAVEFIQVHEVTPGLVAPTITDSDGLQFLVPENKFSPEDLYKSRFTIAESGGGTPYYVFKYKVGRGSTVEPTIYTFQINVDTTYAINLISQTISGPIFYTDELGQEIGLLSEISQIQVTGGNIFGTVKLLFDLSNLLPINPPNDIERLMISLNDQTIEKTNSFQTFEVIGIFNDSGQLNIQTEYLKDQNELNPSGDFQISILEIDGVSVGAPITLIVPSEL